MEVVKNNDTELVTHTVEIGTSVVHDVSIEDSTELEIAVNKREYVITGDDIYIAGVSDSVPQWLTDVIDETVTLLLASTQEDVADSISAIRNALDQIEAAKNTYSESIISRADIEGVIVAKLETLNATVQNNAASIKELDVVKTTASQALAISAKQLNAEIDNGRIGAAITTLSSAIATEAGARAIDYTALNSSFLNNQAAVTQTLSTHASDIFANASAITDINVSLSDTNDDVLGLATAATNLYATVGYESDGVTPTGTGLAADVIVLQKQNDGIIETVTGEYAVVNSTNDLIVTVEPYATWIAEDTINGNQDVRLSKIGDVYIRYSTTSEGAKEYVASYKFIKTEVDSTSPDKTDADGFTWAVITDNAAQDAYTEALNAYDLADGKRRVFVGLGSTGVPNSPYEQGDLWLIDAERTVNDIQCKIGDLLRCIDGKGSSASYEQNDWVLASSYQTAIDNETSALESWKTDVYGQFVSDIQTQVDNKAESFYTENMPHTEGTNIDYAVWVGDLWKKPSTNDEYIYQKVDDNYEWVLVNVPDSVFDTIDGKKAIYVGDSLPSPVAPVTLEVNDMWITGDNPVGDREGRTIYVWNGTTWSIPVKYTDDSAVATLSTGLEDGTVSINLSNATVDGTVSLTSYVANEIDKEVVVYSGTDHTTQTGMKENDLFIEKTTDSSGAVTVDVVNTYKYVDTEWVQIGNNNNITALADLADGKRTIYSNVSNDAPTGDANDIWIPTNGTANETYVPGEVYQYIGNPLSWELATRYTEDLSIFAEEVTPKLTTLKTQVDGKIEYYYYDNPTNNPLDTISSTWGEAEHGNVVYYKEIDEGYWYNSSTDTFEAIADTSMLKSLQVAESKTTVYYRTTKALMEAISDVLQDGDMCVVEGDGTNDGTYVYNSNVWKKSVDGVLTATAGDVTSINAYTFPDGRRAAVLEVVENGGVYSYAVKAYTLDSTDPYDNGTRYGIPTADQYGTEFSTSIKVGDPYESGTSWEPTYTDVKKASEVTGVSGADSVSGSYIKATRDAVESGWKYSSDTIINGEVYTSGFGLSATGDGTGTLADPYQSEFWINADKLRMVGSSHVYGDTAADPFTITRNIDGTNQISFNGNMSINSIKQADGSDADIGRFHGKLSVEPTTANNGDTYYNTNTSVMMYYNGTSWVSTQGFTPAIIEINASSATFVKDKVGQVTPASILLGTTVAGVTNATYRWQKNDVDVSGATEGTYSVPVNDYTNVSTNTYKCIVTGTIYGVTNQVIYDAVTIPRLDSATDVPVVTLGNENITFAGPVSGYSGIIFTGGLCTIAAHIGSTQLTYGTSGSNTYSITLSGASGVTVTATNGTVNAPTAMSSDSAYVDVVVTLRNSVGVALPTVIKRITYSLSRVGFAAPIFYITNTDSKFVKAESGVVSPSTLTLSTFSNLASVTSYNWYSSTDGGSTWSASLGTSSSYIISGTGYTAKMYKCTLIGVLNGQTLTLEDKVIIPLLVDASDAITIINSNEAIPLATTAISGSFTLPTSGVNSEITVYKGSTKLDYVTTLSAANQWTASITTAGFSTAPTGAGSTSTDVYTVTAAGKVMSSDNASVTVAVTVRNAAGTDSTVNRVVNYSLTRKGDVGVQGSNSAVTTIYYVNTSATVAPTATISGTFTYTFATGTLSGGTLNGWATSLPTTSAGQYIWARQATAVSNTTTDTIAYTEFSAATCISGTGTNGTNGLNSAPVFLYRKTSTSVAPALFTGTFTYTFSTKTLSGGTLNSWTTSAPTLTNGEYLWMAQATASSTTDTDAIAYTEFSASVIIAIGGINGVTGSRGPGWYSASGTSWSDTTANSTTPGDNVVGDIVTISGTSFSQAKKWDGSSWIAPGLYMNGDMIVEKSITAAQVDAANILTQVITLNSSGADAKITNTAGTMTIDFKNGSIYIA